MPNKPAHTSSNERVESASAAPARAGRWGVRVSGSVLACAVFLLTVAIPLAYLGGVMIGREYPVREKTEAELLAEAVERPAAVEHVTGRKAQEPDEADKEPVSRILRPYELGFSRLLHMAPGEKEVGRVRPLAPAVDPRARAAAQPAMPEMLPGMSPAVAEGPPQPPTQKAEAYDFVFQVAAFRGMTAAESAKRRLESAGYKASLEKSGRLVLVLVKTRGPESRANEVREDMLRMNMGAPIERSRKPVFRPGGR